MLMFMYPPRPTAATQHQTEFFLVTDTFVGNSQPEVGSAISVCHFMLLYSPCEQGLQHKDGFLSFLLKISQSPQIFLLQFYLLSNIF